MKGRGSRWREWQRRKDEWRGGRGNNRRKKYVHVHEEMMKGQVMEKLRESNSRECNEGCFAVDCICMRCISS